MVAKFDESKIRQSQRDRIVNLRIWNGMDVIGPEALLAHHASVAARLVTAITSGYSNVFPETEYGHVTRRNNEAWWTLAMLVYPDTQHAELDAIVGRARLNTFAHYPHLLYRTSCHVKEVLH